jgi:uncharacterized protein YicC (UPF0701 family)
MSRRLAVFLAALALAVPLASQAAPDEAQRRLMQRSAEANRTLEQARSASGAQRQKLMQEHMALMNEMMKSMHEARPGPNATPQQMREWIDEHLKLMDRMMSQMMDAQRMMMGPMPGGSTMMKDGMK